MVRLDWRRDEGVASAQCPDAGIQIVNRAIIASQFVGQWIVVGGERGDGRSDFYAVSVNTRAYFGLTIWGEIENIFETSSKIP